MFRFFKRKPQTKRVTYNKFGFVITETTYCYCPKCNEVLNAGPNYQPKNCSNCGQKLDFRGMQWKPDKQLGYAKEEVR